MAITDKKISIIYPGRDISSLSDRPNADGMSASDLKARFDQLGKEVIPKLNALIDELFADLYSGTSQNGHTHNLDNIVDGITYKLFTALERAKLSAIAENAEVNQNAFSNIKVGSTTIASDNKTDTFELVAGLNITMTVDALTKKVFFSATGDLATEAVQSLIVDIGNYYDALNVEDALQEIGYALANLSGSAEDIAITDVGEYFTSENVEGALQEVGLSLTNKVDKVTGKGLSTEDYTSAEKTKLSGVAENANNYAHPANHAPSIIEQDENNRFVTDAEKTAWNSKAPISNPTFTGLITTGGQIKFPATQVPSADPNTLDDYEEGTFTATLTSATPPTSPPTTIGLYTKTGRQVTVSLVFENVNTTGGSGHMSITGLPFILFGARAVGGAVSLGLGSTPFSPVVGNLTIFFYNHTTLADIPIVAGTAKYLYVTITYMTN